MKHIKLFLESMDIPGISGKKVNSWINVKIDKDLPLRISRYTRSIDEFANLSGKSIEEKLDVLSNPKANQYGPQCKLSIILLLQYLKEIKSNFDASSSGHLFEDYIAGLLHSRKEGGYKSEDFIDDYKNTYQIKFYAYGTSKIVISEKICDKYIFGLKLKDEAHIWVFNWNDLVDLDLVLQLENGKYEVNITKLKKEKNYYNLSFKNIDKSIKVISESLREFIKNMYDEISDFNYNIETIITGVNKENDIIDYDKVDVYYSYAENNIKRIESNLTDVKKKIKKAIRRYQK